MPNDKNPGQRNMEEEETGETDRREEQQRRNLEDAERRARPGSPQTGGKDAPARPGSDRGGDNSGGSRGGKRY